MADFLIKNTEHWVDLLSEEERITRDLDTEGITVWCSLGSITINGFPSTVISTTFAEINLSSISLESFNLNILGSEQEVVLPGKQQDIVTMDVKIRRSAWQEAT